MSNVHLHTIYTISTLYLHYTYKISTCSQLVRAAVRVAAVSAHAASAAHPLQQPGPAQAIPRQAEEAELRTAPG